MDAALSGEDLKDAPTRHALRDSLPIRRRLTGEQAEARTALVRRLRIALPIVALLLIGALLVNTRSAKKDSAFLEDFTDLEASPEELRMANPRFAGVNDKGYPYEITAEEASQTPGQQDVVELFKPRAVTSGADQQTVVHAERGVFQSKANVLTLDDNVTLEHRIGVDTYQLRTDRAVVSIGDETVETSGPVEGEGTTGTLRADSMRAYNGEGRVVFEGNVSMRIYPAKADRKKKETQEEPETP